MDKEKRKLLLDKFPDREKNIINALMNAAGFIREDLLIEQFYLVIDKISFLVQKLFGSIQCKTGCNLCCHESGNPEVSVVECQLISEVLEEIPADTREKIISNLTAALNGISACPLLVDGQCAIYPYRPLTCRLTGYFLKENKSEKLKVLGSESNLIPQTCSTEKKRWQAELEKKQLANYLYIFLPVAEKFETALKNINGSETTKDRLSEKLKEKFY